MTDVGVRTDVEAATVTDAVAGVGSGCSTGWTAELYRDGTMLDRLAGEWRDLYARSPAATPFQTHAWLTAWWRNYGKRGGLRLVLVRRHGRLVAAAPMMAVRRWGCPVLIPLASPQSDYTDFLVAGDEGQAAVWHLTRALLAAPGWSALDLQEVRPGSAAHAVAETWPRPSWRTPASTCLELPAADIGDIIARLPGRSAGKLRAKLRRIDACGIAVAPVPAGLAAAGVDRLLDLHIQQWQGRPINPEHTRPRFRRHLAEALTGMIRDEQAALFEYRWEGGLVASDLVLIGHDFVGAYLYGAEAGLRDIIEVTLMLLRQDLGVARGTGVPSLSMLRGDEPYKRKWRPLAVPNERLILARTPSVASTYAAAARCRAELSARRHRRRGAVPAGGAARG
ncbi:GNAT family N-acetyltransferase [Actinomadura vinacea]|uniref:GNAT family N-acetyltransferase n=1 Tax=Actinomadura vinacea TaxID=115336 RepID=A0ABN3JR03_9ACTN